MGGRIDQLQYPAVLKWQYRPRGGGGGGGGGGSD